jgi:hypothetical protein
MSEQVTSAFHRILIVIPVSIDVEVPKVVNSSLVPIQYDHGICHFQFTV